MPSLVILTYNSIKFIQACLDSVFNQGYQGLEVIVVDNGSADGTAEFIKENYLQVRLIENKKNLGAAKARNQGIEISRGEWILTLDCDIILEKDFLSKIMGFAKDSEENVGIVQPKIFKTGKENIYSCGIYLSPLRRFYDIGMGRKDNKKFDRSGPIFGACSAAALYKRQMLNELKEKTGYFDERFFFLVEDVDLSWRARKKGYRALLCPGALCYHSGNSSRMPRKVRQYLCLRNRYYTLIKNETNIFSLIFYLFFYDLPRLMYLFCANYYVRDFLISGKNHSTNICY